MDGVRGARDGGSRKGTPNLLADYTAFAVRIAPEFQSEPLNNQRVRGSSAPLFGWRVRCGVCTPIVEGFERA